MMAKNGAGNDRLVPCARAKFDFEAKSGVELGFSAGVSLRLFRRIDDNWLEGELDGRVGIFPAAYVDIELSVPSKTRENALAKSGRPYAIGLFDFSGDCEGDLPFAKGELIELVGSVAGSGWMKGKTGRGEGIFPSSFVEILKLPVSSGVSPPTTPVYELPGAGASSRRSPEYALPGEIPVRGGSCLDAILDATELRRDRGGRREILVNGFSDEGEITEGDGTQPVATPRRRKASLSGQEGGMVGGERESPLSPASPLGPSPPRQLYHSATVPRPKPRNMTRASSLSELQRQLNTLQTGLDIEKKLLHSARTLLQVSQDEAKRDKLKTSIATHEATVKSLKQSLRDLKAQRETVNESSNSPPPFRPSSPPDHQLPPPKPPSVKQQRAKVIKELVTTEADYHSQMFVCCEKLIPALKEIPEINSELLFGNLREVTCVSHDMLVALTDTCQEEEKVGAVFVKFGPRLRAAYGVYCRNHDSASALVEKYSENPDLMKSIKGALDAIKAETQAWDLQSLLIKPVQRILKYPLLLDKLVQTTGDDHPDYKPVHQAREVVGQVAQDINEIRRRKDLVERYTGVGKGEHRGSVSVHSLQKKVRRFQQTLTQRTGLRSKTVDPKFDELVQKMIVLETFLRQLIRNVTTWQDELQKVMDSHELLCEGMSLYAPSSLRTLTSYQRGVNELEQAVKDHGVSVSAHVLGPFQSLLALFQDPLHLISKRRDKLLDFDHLQYALDHHTEDPEKIRQLRDACTMAKRNYEALNEQLIEELPHFIQLAQNMINHVLVVVVQLQYKFHSAVHTILEWLADLAGMRVEGQLLPLMSDELQQDHSHALAEVAGHLISLSIVPASLAMNYTLSGSRAGSRRVSEEVGNISTAERGREDSVISTSSEMDMDSSIAEEPPNDPLGPPDDPPGPPDDPPDPPVKGTELVVVYDFEAQDKSELSVSAGQTVILQCPHDRIGCMEWWLVESHHGTGYVPASFLDYT